MRSATVYNFLIEANILAGIAIVLMLVVRKFLRGKLGNRVLWFAWLLVAARLLCPLALPNPAINEIRPAHSQNQGVRPIADQIRIRFMDTADNLSIMTRGRGPLAQLSMDAFSQTYNGRLGPALLWVYFGGAGLVLLYMVFQNTRFLRRLKKNRVEKLSGEMWEKYLALCKEQKVRPVPVYLTDPLPSACLTGVFRPMIALPVATPPEDMMRVLAHESCHLKGHDNLWGLVRNICCVVHWFNPLVWGAASMSRTDCELKCDARVIDKLDKEDKLAYAGMLVTSSAQKGLRDVTVLATCMSMTGRQMKQRVSLIVNDKKTLRWLAFSFASLACVTLLFAFATAEYTGPVFVPEPPKAVEGFAAFHTITDEEEALAYAKAFLGSEAVGADVDKLSIKINYEPADWYVRAYLPTKAMPYNLTFNSYGMVTYFSNDVENRNDTRPVASPITGATKEGAGFIAYVTAFADTMLPGVSTAFESIHIDSDTKNGFGRYLTMTTENGRTKKAHAFVLQIEPQVRLLSFQPQDESYRVFNLTDKADALGAYTMENAIADCSSLLTETTGLTKQQVDSGTITAEFLPEEKVWVARFTIAADQVKGDLRNQLREEYGPGDSFTVESLTDGMGKRLNYKNLYAYSHRDDLIISKDQAMKAGLEAVSKTLGVDNPTSRVVDFYAEKAEYHVFYRTIDGGPWGTAQVDIHTGQTKQILDLKQEGDAKFIAPAVQTSAEPKFHSIPLDGLGGIDAYLTSLQNEKGQWGFWTVEDKAKLYDELLQLKDAYPAAGRDMGYLEPVDAILEHKHTLPTAQEIPQTKAEDLARDAVAQKYKLKPEDVQNFQFMTLFYEDEPGHPIWEIQPTLHTYFWDYAVKLDARTGTVIAVTDRATYEQAIAPAPTPAKTKATPAPQEDEIAKEQAISLAKRAIMERYGLDAQTVNGFTLYSAQYAGAGTEYNDLGMMYDKPFWCVCFSLNDPRTPYDYAVILNAKTGEVLQVYDPSNISNG
jgi:beta-lactamase regulating signal transducer with metallopeptidase domain